ncbi:aspartate--ammonia ligase [Mycoplasmopsis columbinasalis]|uniref:Aspartate--ammonia ligase n=1 Tax=Mycoplasmopsis columbinasalis TaxID=114880 RepID=A0A449BAB8_9BACT|nr:aspartate--ammonia ligase [Mycoplasmopsis columbinasalis]VEU78151.1 Aspartate--ammonia ligase [Mycoplasmopsis columbinasalis]
MYRTKLNVKETQLAIQDLKYLFIKNLSKTLHLTRVSAPLFVRQSTKINDGLSGETPVSFNPKQVNETLEIVHSLAKWKREALHRYGFNLHEGIWADMNAIRQHENLDYLHSYYVDQWDWELIIDRKERNLEFLKSVVQKIYKTVRFVEHKLIFDYPQLVKKLPEELVFISSQELADKYPNLTPTERENVFAREVKAFFVYQVGYPLQDGIKHSDRAFDYDDWELNGDLIFYDYVNDKAIEVSSMGIRVDADSLKKQAAFVNKDKNDFGAYHIGIFEDSLPLTIGGGIGQSRLSMFLLEKKHIGEVQAAIWPKEMLAKCKEENVHLL